MGSNVWVARLCDDANVCAHTQTMQVFVQYVLNPDKSRHMKAVVPFLQSLPVLGEKLLGLLPSGMPRPCVCAISAFCV